MQNIDWTLVAPWVSGIGSLSAAITALYLARWGGPEWHRHCRTQTYFFKKKTLVFLIALKQINEVNMDRKFEKIYFPYLEAGKLIYHELSSHMKKDYEKFIRMAEETREHFNRDYHDNLHENEIHQLIKRYEKEVCSGYPLSVRSTEHYSEHLNKTCPGN